MLGNIAIGMPDEIEYFRGDVTNVPAKTTSLALSIAQIADVRVDTADAQTANNKLAHAAHVRLTESTGRLSVDDEVEIALKVKARLRRKVFLPRYWETRSMRHLPLPGSEGIAERGYSSYSPVDVSNMPLVYNIVATPGVVPNSSCDVADVSIVQVTTRIACLYCMNQDTRGTFQLILPTCLWCTTSWQLLDSRTVNAM